MSLLYLHIGTVNFSGLRFHLFAREFFKRWSTNSKHNICSRNFFLVVWMALFTVLMRLKGVCAIAPGSLYVQEPQLTILNQMSILALALIPPQWQKWYTKGDRFKSARPRHYDNNYGGVRPDYRPRGLLIKDWTTISLAIGLIGGGSCSLSLSICDSGCVPLLVSWPHRCGGTLFQGRERYPVLFPFSSLALGTSTYITLSNNRVR